MEENETVTEPETETSTDEMNVRLDIEVNGHKEEPEAPVTDEEEEAA